MFVRVSRTSRHDNDVKRCFNSTESSHQMVPSQHSLHALIRVVANTEFVTGVEGKEREREVRQTCHPTTHSHVHTFFVTQWLVFTICHTKYQYKCSRVRPSEEIPNSNALVSCHFMNILQNIFTSNV